MPARCLQAHPVAKPWGRRTLWGGFQASSNSPEPVGEVWFEPPAGSPLLLKLLFTAEPLSIQVHPDDTAAAAHGLPCGKDEAWWVLQAEPGACVALGPKAPWSRAELAAAARGGSLSALMHWREVRAGELIDVPAGTVHALGAGLVVVEVQRAVDCTLRLWDHGRPRALQVDEAVAVARLQPAAPLPPPRGLGPGREQLCANAHFVVERWSGPGQGQWHAPATAATHAVPLQGRGWLDGQACAPGSAWHLQGRTRWQLEPEAQWLVAWARQTPPPEYATD